MPRSRRSCRDAPAGAGAPGRRERAPAQEMARYDQEASCLACAARQAPALTAPSRAAAAWRAAPARRAVRSRGRRGCREDAARFPPRPCCLLLVSAVLTLSISVLVRSSRHGASRRDRSARHARRLARDRRTGRLLQHHGRPHRARGSRAARPPGGTWRHVAERTRQLHHPAHHDPLTQLPNRRTLGVPHRRSLAPAASSASRPVRRLRQLKSINDTPATASATACCSTSPSGCARRPWRGGAGAARRR